MTTQRGTMEVLSEKATLLRESLQKSQSNTESMVAILGSFDHRLSALDTAMRPTQVRTRSIRMAHDNINKTLKVAEVILAQFDLSRQAEAKILRGPHEDLESYLEAVDQLRKIGHFFSSYKSLMSREGVLNHINGLLAKAILKLEEEFKQLLSSYSKPVEPDRLFDCLPNSLRPTPAEHSGDIGKINPGASNAEHQSKSLENGIYKPPTLIPPRIVPLLHDLAQQMVQAGRHQQCLKIYGDVRASALEQSLRKLGVERLNKDDVQKMQWEVLEAKIGNWIHFMRIAVKLLFAGEKKICDEIFDDVDNNLKQQCFADVTANSVATLLSFGEAIAKSKRSPEKLFVLLDMYEIMRELHGEMQTIFEGKACFDMRDSALYLIKRLAQTAQETFGDFEEAVEKDASKTTVLDGTVHPLTSYVLNYVKFLFDYQTTLNLLFKEFDTGNESDSQLAVLTTRIMQALQTNLDGKSKQYKDQALTSLFLMNNIHYMVRSVRRCVILEELIIIPCKVTFHNNRVIYVTSIVSGLKQRIYWVKTGFKDTEGLYNNMLISTRGLHGLRFTLSDKAQLKTLTFHGAPSGGGGGPGGNDAGGTSGVSRATVKDRFKSFNVQFEELHQRQSQWTVPDQELRESLRLAVGEVLLPAYRSFLKRFGPMIESGKNPVKYIRFTPEDLDRMLGEFFEGKVWNDPKR